MMIGFRPVQARDGRKPGCQRVWKRTGAARINGRRDRKFSEQQQSFAPWPSDMSSDSLP